MKVEKAHPVVVASEPIEMTALGRLMASLRRCQTVEALCDRVYELLPLLCRVDRASILLFDPESNGLMSNRHLNGERAPGFEVGPQPLSMSISGRCFLEEAPIVVNESQNCDLIPRSVVEQLGLRASLAVPLRSRASMLGVMRLDDCSRADRFHEGEVQWFVAAGEYIGLALENILLLHGEDATDTPASARLFPHGGLAPAKEVGLFEIAFEDAPIGMALVSKGGGFLKVNRALCDIVGYDRDELGRTSFQAITHPDDLGGDLALLQKLLKGDIAHYRIEKRYFHKQGHTVWVMLSVSLARASDGSPQCFVSQIENITARKEADAALARELIYVQMLESIGQIANQGDSIESLIKLVLRTFCVRLEWPVGHCYRAIPTENGVAHLVSTAIWHLPSNAKPYEAFCQASELRVFQPGEGVIGAAYQEGRPVWRRDLAASQEYLRGDAALEAGLRSVLAVPVIVSGQVSHVLEFFWERGRDVDRRLVEVSVRVGELVGRAIERENGRRQLQALNADLSRSNGFLNAVLDNISVGVAACDATGKLVIMNRAAEQFHGKGIKLDVAIEKWPEEYGIFTSDGHTLYSADQLPMVRALAGETVRDEKLIVVSKTGRHIILCSSQAVVDENRVRVGAVAVGHDVSAREEAETVLRKRTEMVRLLQDVSVTANEALSTHEALRRCLELICQHNGWQVGHVFRVESVAGEPALVSMALWYIATPSERCHRFRDLSEALRFGAGSCLPGCVLATHSPEWMNDLPTNPQFLRGDAAAQHNFRSGFALPVLIGSELAAVMEFFSIDPIDPSDRLVEVMANIGAQIGRVMERERSRRTLEEWVAELEARNQTITLTNEMTELLQSCESVGEAYATIRGYGARLFPGAPGAVYVFDGPSHLESVAAWGGGMVLPTIDDAAGCWALRRSRMFKHGGEGCGPTCAHVSSDQLRYVCIPMMTLGEPLGVLHVQASLNLSEREWHARQQLAVNVAEDIVLALANMRLRESLREQSLRDPLTELHNRRYLQQSLATALAESARMQSTLSIMMIDIDHFKNFNDRFGHEAGDLMLKAVADLLRNNAPIGAELCRYGGEEFTILLPDTALEAAAAAAETLRAAAESMTVEHLGRNLGAVTLSIGLAACPQHGATVDQLVRNADEALFNAKGAGRNRVIVSGF